MACNSSQNISIKIKERIYTNLKHGKGSEIDLIVGELLQIELISCAPWNRVDKLW